ncbi:hypothetical protein NQ317_002182 [Molorchus minor]|uniref:Asparagine synthetase domain-containing protein n=1 Tax=Molorchus minor TaxID=1323400 RepID=A0ABQ9IWU8_9CUCU|nr:hypothetical protein NQ317_002182 [Molorchus minor]
MADRRIGCLLSGGLDSSLMHHFLSKKLRRQIYHTKFSEEVIWKKLSEFPEFDRKIYYLDETWVNEGHTG